MDPLDVALVAALQQAPRAPINTLSEVLETSASTVSRRLTRLFDDRLLRITASISWSLRQTGHPTILWVQTSPASTREVASRIAELPQAQSVYIVSGDTDIHCLLHPTAGGDIGELALDVIPHIPGVERIASHRILATSARSGDWKAPGVLSADQVAFLEGEAIAATASLEAGHAEDRSRPLRRTELRVADLLADSGRITVMQAAEALDITRATAARALETVLASGLVRPRVDVEPELMGFPVEVFAQIRSTPSLTMNLVTELGAHPNVRFAAMTAGVASLVVQANMKGDSDLYTFVTEGLGNATGITDVSLSTNLATVKHNWNIVDGSRLSPVAGLPSLSGEA
ncbi:Lrp/AsnC family transcriptional regulator [Brevibacterium oceani]|uniref:Lrp/AsnC family transcriptional regulator n=1 Tax=Brevibacterium oceani TaxID=358099 RepID=UPI0015E66F57|nr:Lrp/AsnC ligand binding domain-containing protein [Brevibacterium oceani]